jgi:hypothetical protein
MDDDLHKVMEEAEACLARYKSLGFPKRETPPRFVARFAEEAGIYPVPNIAVEVCVSAYVQTRTEEIEKWVQEDRKRKEEREKQEEGESSERQEDQVGQENREKKAENIERLSRIAYAVALPKLTDADSIREFIACVVHGMAIGAIPSSEGARLLFGARIAYSALPGGKKRRKKYTKNTPKTAPQTVPTPVQPIT